MTTNTAPGGVKKPLRLLEVVSVMPRLLRRKDAAPYMGRSLRKFDKIKRKYRVVVDGMVLYDRVLMDRDIDLSHAA